MPQVYWNTFPIRVSFDCFVGDRLCSVESALAYISNSPKDMLRYAVCLKEDDFIIGDVFALREYTDTFSVGWHFNQRRVRDWPTKRQQDCWIIFSMTAAHGVSMDL